METLVTDGDDLSVGQFVGFLEGGGGGSGGHFLLEVQSNIAKFLLDVANDFSLSGGGERVTALGQDLHQVVGQIATSQVFLSHTHHDTLMTGTADDGGEDGAGSVISGESSLAHTGSVINNQSRNIIVTHDESLSLWTA